MSKTSMEPFLMAGELFEREGRTLRAMSNSKHVGGTRFLDRLLVEDVDDPRGIYHCTVDQGDVIRLADAQSESVPNIRPLATPALKPLNHVEPEKPAKKGLVATKVRPVEKSGNAWAALEIDGDPEAVVMS